MVDQLSEIASRVPSLYRGTYLRALRGKGSPRSAIKAKCLECVAWQRREGGVDKVGECGIRGCPLWAFRPFQGKDEESLG